MTTWQFARCSLNQYQKQVDKGKVQPDNIYEVEGVLFGYEGALNWADLDIMPAPYWRNFLPKQAIVDGKATLKLEPSTTYYLMCWKPVMDENEDGYSVAHFTTGTTGKKTLKDLDPDCLYKLAKEETYYTQAPEDLLPELFEPNESEEEEESEVPEIPETEEETENPEPEIPETEETTEPNEEQEPESAEEEQEDQELPE